MEPDALDGRQGFLRHAEHDRPVPAVTPRDLRKAERPGPPFEFGEPRAHDERDVPSVAQPRGGHGRRQAGGRRVPVEERADDGIGEPPRKRGRRRPREAPENLRPAVLELVDHVEVPRVDVEDDPRRRREGNRRHRGIRRVERPDRMARVRRRELDGENERPREDGRAPPRREEAARRERDPECEREERERLEAVHGAAEPEGRDEPFEKRIRKRDADRRREDPEHRPERQNQRSSAREERKVDFSLSAAADRHRRKRCERNEAQVIPTFLDGRFFAGSQRGDDTREDLDLRGNEKGRRGGSGRARVVAREARCLTREGARGREDRDESEKTRGCERRGRPGAPRPRRANDLERREGRGRKGAHEGEVPVGEREKREAGGAREDARGALPPRRARCEEKAFERGRQPADREEVQVPQRPRHSLRRERKDERAERRPRGRGPEAAGEPVACARREDEGEEDRRVVRREEAGDGREERRGNRVRGREGVGAQARTLRRPNPPRGPERLFPPERALHVVDVPEVLPRVARADDAAAPPRPGPQGEEGEQERGAADGGGLCGETAGGHAGRLAQGAASACPQDCLTLRSTLACACLTYYSSYVRLLLLWLPHRRSPLS